MCLCFTVLPMQLASFRQKRAKGDGAGTAKKMQKRKGQTVTQIHNATQDQYVEAAFCPASDTELKANLEVLHIIKMCLNYVVIINGPLSLTLCTCLALLAQSTYKLKKMDHIPCRGCCLSNLTMSNCSIIN